jgi:ATP-dependent DNA helicase PIF1
MNLSPGQDKIFELYSSGENVFVTGPGGSGKSEILKIIYKDCIEKKKKVFVTAMTGVAANILGCNATTLHSWAGIGLGTGKFESILKKIKRSKSKKDSWISTEILIIDEISMLSLTLFVLLDKIGRSIRNKEKPFGGIQLIFSGDFFQLPPISPNEFCFESTLFYEYFKNKVALDIIFRQTDSKFKSLLNNIRVGRITKSNIKLLQTRIGLESPDGICPTILCPTRKQVEKINTEKLNSLGGKEYTYPREEHDKFLMTQIEEKKRKSMTQEEIDYEMKFVRGSTLSEHTLVLKKGAHVMHIVNEEDVYNGSQGIITDFKNGYPVVEYYSGLVKLVTPHIWKSDTVPGFALEQIPLILSWAVTIHKSQGCSLDYAKINIGEDIFEAGQSYVALSRLKDINGLFIETFSPEKIRINKKVMDFYKLFNS